MNSKLEEQEKNFFAAERINGTLRGAVTNNPTAAVRVLGPLETIRIACGNWFEEGTLNIYRDAPGTGRRASLGIDDLAATDWCVIKS
jgi:hypothetical protein